ncbi:MAG: Gfo/Idh/MocA family oxidoreductase [Bacteroidetes bacterium]|nr:Gfo/Idh/MocA family oxidoreductase [Bacteroidota bacterium]MDA1120047.1 Gfo/Idh/MocA family oxidoreductase [Bacteroidota bacterium]
MKTMNVGIIGYQFMGKAHSNGWIKAPLFFDLNIKPELKVACGRNKSAVKAFADKWGWQEVKTDWKKVVENPDVDIIDISLPQHLHYDVAIAAAKNGKHIFCEKPMAHSRKQAEEMLKVAEDNGVLHYLNHNYRRTPAVLLAKQLIDEGKIGRIFHWRGAYQQDWIVDPNFPLTWQLQKETAHAGPHWDLNSHSVDLALFLMGDIKTVSCLTTNFIKERPLPSEGATAFSSGTEANTEMGQVTVEDAALMMVEFESGAVGSFEATRFATGRKNSNTFEIYGSKGSVAFNMERMNELQYFTNDDPDNAQGFRTIMATESSHAYVSHWWPPGHIIGYEHGFVHAMADFMMALDKKEKIFPNFNDGVKILAVLESGLESAKFGEKVKVV